MNMATLQSVIFSTLHYLVAGFQLKNMEEKSVHTKKLLMIAQQSLYELILQHADLFYFRDSYFLIMHII